MKRIKYLVMDVDGTLTDGKIYIGENGEIMKSFNVKDGYAIHNLLPLNGITPVIITGRSSKIVVNRARDLGIELVYQGVANKLELLMKLASESNTSLDEVAYIGDDNNDLDCIKACALSGCPADAAEEVKGNVAFISPYLGGAGAVRDFIEYIITRNNGEK